MSEQREEIIRPPQDIKPSSVNGGGWKELAKIALPAVLVGLILYMVVLPQYTTLKESDKRVNSMITTISALSDRLKGDEGTIATLSSQVTGTSKQIQEIQTSLNNIQTTVNGYNNKLSNLPSQSDITAIQTSLSALSNKVESLPDTIKEDYTAEIEELQESIDNMANPVAATITGFTPTSGVTGASVVITGTNFNGVTAVSFGGVSASGYTVNSATQITAIVGNGNDGVISVTTSAGTVSSIATFDYTGTTTTTTGVTTSYIPTSIFQVPNAVNITITNNSGSDIFGGQLTLTIQYIDATPSISNMVELSSTGIAWGSTGSISGITLTRVGTATGLYILNGQSKIITVDINPPPTGTQFRVTSVVYSGYTQ
jgi:archaellum component FlaC